MVGNGEEDGWGGMPREKRPTPPPPIHNTSSFSLPHSTPPNPSPRGGSRPATWETRDRRGLTCDIITSSAMRDVGSGALHQNERCCVGMFQSVLAGMMAKPTPRTPHGNSYSPLMGSELLCTTNTNQPTTWRRHHRPRPPRPRPSSSPRRPRPPQPQPSPSPR
jgi:hypothetical protein